MTATGIIVLARMDSRRLPGKAMTDLGGRPLLGRVLDRACRIPGDHRLVVATSDRAIDDPIADFAAALGVAVFRGSTDDVAQRILACADALGLERIARISGDSPFIDPALVARLLARHAERQAEIVTNVLPRTFPAGLSVEVVGTEVLRRILDMTRDAQDREHVTRYVYAHPERFDVHNVPADVDDSDLVLTIDTPEDLARARWLVAQLGDTPEQASSATVIALGRRWSAEYGVAPGNVSVHG